MLFYLAMMFRDQVSVLNVLTYHTVRAGAAAITGFLLCLILGPMIIERLRDLKIGQYIKKEHVGDLHALHKGKAGTPTMGGALIIVATVLSLMLWSKLTNHLLLVAITVLCLLGAVGFIDDYIKLKRKHNDGLSAKAKLAGQILVGSLLGLYLIFNPITISSTSIASKDIIDWQGFIQAITDSQQSQAVNAFSQRLSKDLRSTLEANPNRRSMLMLLKELNSILEREDLYDADIVGTVKLNGESHTLLNKGVVNLNRREVARLNRLFLEASFPKYIAGSVRNLHTTVGVPGFKNLMLPLGSLYILFVILIIAGTSNAVNVTDGLDGLAAGASVISLLAFTGIAYVASRADWSRYLFLTYVPEASELTVFGAALIGTGLGFLWYNSHPAEVFMGDTGSLALGGAIATMAILTKQELLLPIVAGLFVLEAMSVVIQVLSFKMTGRRVFRMAPLHHHFELKGWSESKITIRFWIIAVLFALMSLGTLKLR